jgi:hypothetical protein
MSIVTTSRNNENQPRRNEEHEDFFFSFFVLFVSSWLIFGRGDDYEQTDSQRLYKNRDGGFRQRGARWWARAGGE